MPPRPGIRDLLLSVQADADLAALQNTAAELNALDAIEAEAELQVVTGDAELAIKRVQTGLADVDATVAEPRIDLNTAAAIAQLKLLDSYLDKLDRRVVSPQVGGGGRGVTGGPGGVLGGVGPFSGRGLALALGLSAPLLPTLGSSLAQAGVGAGATAVGIVGPASVGLAGLIATIATAVPQVEALTEAQDNLNVAVDTYGRRSEEAAEARKALSKVERQSNAALPGLIDQAQEFGDAWREAMDDAITRGSGEAIDVLDRLEEKLPRVGKSADSATKAVGLGIDNLLDRVVDTGEFDDFLDHMDETFLDLSGPGSTALANILRLLMRIATAAAPDVIEMAKSFARMTGDWLRGSDNAKGFRREVHRNIEQFRSWLRLIGAIFNLLGALFLGQTERAREGRDAVDGMTRKLDEWASWIRTHRDEVDDFFVSVLDTIRELVDAFGGLFELAKPVGEAMQPISSAIASMAKALNSLQVGNISALTALLAVYLGKRLLPGGGAPVPVPVGSPGGLLSRVKGWGVKGLAGRAGLLGLGITAADQVFSEVGRSEAAGSGDLMEALTAKAGVYNDPGAFNAVSRAFGSGGDKEAQTVIDNLEAIQEAQGNVSTAKIDALVESFGDLEGMSGEAKAEFRAIVESARDARIQLKTENFADTITAQMAAGRDDLKGIVKDYGRQFDNLPEYAQKNAIRTTREHLKGLVSTKTITRKQMGEILDLLRDRYGDNVKATQRGIARMVNTFASGWDALNEATSRALGNKGGLGDLVNRFLSTFGFDPIDFKAPTVSKIGQIIGTGRALLGIQTGGVVPGRGEGDSVHTLLEPEEGVVNKRAMRAGGRQIVEWLNDRIPRFAKGGIVTVPGYPGERASSAIMGPMLGFMRQFKLFLTDAFGPGHASPEHTRLGTAADFVPGPGGSWGLVARAAHAAVARGWTPVGWDGSGGTEGWAGHGPGEHLHVVFLTAAEAASGMKLKGGAALGNFIKQMKIRGPAGAMRDSGDAILERARKEANKFLSSKSATAEGAEGGAIMSGSGEVESTFARVAKRLSRSRLATLALGMAGFAESGMQDLSGGDASSQGALQLLASTAAGLGVSPHDEAAIASLFLTRGFFGRGGANALAAQGLSAQMVAQLVQGSAFSDGSNYAAQRGPALAWMKRYGLARGIRDFPGGWGLVGDDGPELAYMPKGAGILAADATRNLLDGLEGLSRRPVGRGGGGGEGLRVVIEDRRTRVLFDGEEVRAIYRDERSGDAQLEQRLERMGRG